MSLVFLAVRSKDREPLENARTGPQISNRALVNALRQLGISVKLLCPKLDLLHLLRIGARDRKRRIHFGHQGKWPFVAMLCLMLIGRRTSMTIHGNAVIEAQLCKSTTKRPPLLYFWGMCLLAKSIIVVSPNYREWLPERFIKKAKYLPNGCEAAAHHECIQAPKKVQSSIKQLVITGGDRPEKGLAFFLASLSLLEIRLKQRLRVTIFGEVTNPALLQHISSSQIETRVINHIAQADFFEFLRTTDLFVQPSKFETFGMSALESVFLRVPLIVTRECGISSILQSQLNLGKHRIAIIQYGDCQAFANAMRDLLTGEQNTGDIPEEFSKAFQWKQIARDFMTH